MITLIQQMSLSDFVFGVPEEMSLSGLVFHDKGLFLKVLFNVVWKLRHSKIYLLIFRCLLSS